MKLTGDDIICALFAEQGYLVVGSYCPLEIGSVPPWAEQIVPVHIPVRIIGDATWTEFEAQQRRANEMVGGLFGRGSRFSYFYRVAALD